MPCIGQSFCCSFSSIPTTLMATCMDCTHHALFLVHNVHVHIHALYTSRPLLLLFFPPHDAHEHKIKSVGSAHQQGFFLPCSTATSLIVTAVAAAAPLQEVLSPSHPTQASLPCSLRVQVRARVPVEAAGGNSPCVLLGQTGRHSLLHIMHKLQFQLIEWHA